jgi:hypothetical protein
MKDIRQDKTESSLFDLLQKYKNNRLKFPDSIIRNNEWNFDQKSAYVESMLVGLHLPTIYLLENNDGTRYCFDGFNRIRTKFDYYDGKFALQNLKFLPEYNGLLFDKLPGVKQSRFEDLRFKVVTIQPPFELDSVYELLQRVHGGRYVDKETFLLAIEKIKSF